MLQSLQNTVLGTMTSSSTVVILVLVLGRGFWPVYTKHIYMYVKNFGLVSVEYISIMYVTVLGYSGQCSVARVH